ncbi:MAG: CobW family GTP-binding protein [Rubrivivax sp.]
MDARVPVTVLTGWLGAGKTTLLNRILQAEDGRRYAVVVNEFGEIGIDHELLVGAREELFELSNGCVCCTVRGDLIRTLHALLARSDRFDAIVVETTGLADPGPVAQTFFVDPLLRERTQLDSITTVVDAHHVLDRLARSREAVEQVAFADQIVLNKADLVDASTLAQVRRHLSRLNPLAPVQVARRADVPLSALLGCGSFDLQRIVGLEPGFLSAVSGSAAQHIAHGEPGHVHDEHCAHHDPLQDPPEGLGHDHAPDPRAGGLQGDPHGVRSIALTSRRPMDATRVERWLTGLVKTRGADILRAKGIVDVAGDERRLVFQAVHMILEGDWQRPWRTGEDRFSRLVFIGRHLDAQLWQGQFDACAA